MSGVVNIVWAPQPGPQAALIECPAPIIFYGGARGGGKTDGMLGKWALKESRYRDHFNAIMLRKTTVSAEDAIRRSKQIYIPLGGIFNESTKTWRMPNGGSVTFGYLETISDAERYQGQNLTDAWVEEAGQYADPAPIDRLFGALRSASGVPTQLVLTANPGGPGQNWLRDRFKLYPLPSEVQLVEFAIEMFDGRRDSIWAAVIPSRLKDNRVLVESDPDYEKKLYLVGNRELVRAWLEGDWSAIEGAFFDEWSDKHIIRPFEIPEEWTKLRSFDWGSAAPFSVGWWAIAGHEFPYDGRVIPEGAMIRYREWYGAKGPNKGLKLTAEEIARGILSREDERIDYAIADPACFAEDGGPSHAARMADEGVIFSRADNKRIARVGHMGGWDMLRQRLKGRDGQPMIYCFDTCRDSIRTIPILQHDEKKPEDLDTEQEDHCFVADTEIIEKDGKVWSDGAWRYYRNARLTRRDAILCRIRFDDGSSVRCTPDHRFLTSSGWVEARHLSQKTLPLSRPPGKSSGACVTTFAAITSCAHGAGTVNGIESDCIEPSGCTIKGRSLTAITYTTRTVIARIIGSITLRLSRPQAICLATLASVWRMARCSLQALTHADAPRSGMQVQAGINGINVTMKTMSVGSGGSRSKRIARCVAWIMGRWPLGVTSPSSALVHANSVRCVGVEPLGRGDVYCLTVPDTGRFTLANGVTVANCADEWRYACMSRPWIAVQDTPEEPSTDAWGRFKPSGETWRTI